MKNYLAAILVLLAACGKDPVKPGGTAPPKPLPFSGEAPAQYSPLAGELPPPGDITYRWGSVSGATHYLLQVEQVDRNGNYIYWHNINTGTGATPLDTVRILPRRENAPMETARWRVWAIGHGEEQGLKSPWIIFRIR